MGILEKLNQTVQAKLNSIVNKMDDPIEDLDISYEKQKEYLGDINEGITTMRTQKKFLESKRVSLTSEISKLQTQAKTAVDVGRDDLATTALTRKEGLASQIAGIDSEISDITSQEAKLIATQGKLKEKIEAFRTKKETLKATYEASKATTRVNESLTGIGDQIGNLNSSITNIEEKIEKSKSRSTAIEELVADGTLNETGIDNVTSELENIDINARVQAELAELKAAKSP